MSEPSYSRRTGVETRPLGGAAVLVVPEEHLYFAVNRVGLRIWELLEQPRTLEDLVRALAREFAIGEADCRREAEAFLRQLASQRLIESSTGA